MGPIQRAVRRALNPISTRLTMLVQGVGTRRALGVGRGHALPRGFATYSSSSPARTGWRPRIGRGSGRGRALTAPAARSTGDGGAGQVVVPDLIGLSWDDAREVLHRVRLVAVGPDPDGPPLAALGWPDGVVVDQRPDPARCCRSDRRSRSGSSGVLARRVSASRDVPSLHRARHPGCWTRKPTKPSDDATQPVYSAHVVRRGAGLTS